jgi:hypothetical protein
MTDGSGSPVHLQNPALCPHCGRFLAQLPESAFEDLIQLEP